MSSPQGGNGWWTFAPPASTSLIMTTAIVIFGRAIREEDAINGKLVTAFVLLLLTLGFLNSIDPGFASVMALLIFTAVFLTYGPDILRYVGFNLEQES